MKGERLLGLTAIAPPAARNGRQCATKKNGAPLKRSRQSDPHTDSRPVPQPPAPFAAVPPDSIDAPMWPVHPVVWFQPDLAPSLPGWSGLAIERKNRIPSPDFLVPETRPSNRTDGLSSSPEVLRPDSRPDLPKDGLALLGLDPRAVCRAAEINE
jgi:hypothetical protein